MVCLLIHMMCPPEVRGVVNACRMNMQARLRPSALPQRAAVGIVRPLSYSCAKVRALKKNVENAAGGASRGLSKKGFTGAPPYSLRRPIFLLVFPFRISPLGSGSKGHPWHAALRTEALRATAR